MVAGGIGPRGKQGKKNSIARQGTTGNSGSRALSPGSIESVVSGPTSKPISGPVSGNPFLGTTRDRSRRNRRNHGRRTTMMGPRKGVGRKN